MKGDSDGSDLNREISKLTVKYTYMAVWCNIVKILLPVYMEVQLSLQNWNIDIVILL
jgi:hypothetical protein